MSRSKLSWKQRLDKIVKEQEHKQMLKSIYSTSDTPKVSYMWVITNIKTLEQCHYRKSVKVTNCLTQVLIREIDNTTTYYSKRTHTIELCK